MSSVTMDEHATSSPVHNYILKHDSVEQTRLSAQYKFMKKVLDRESAAPDCVDLNNVTNVLDAACGTLAWMFDFLSSPDIRARASSLSGSESESSISNSIKLYACDITDEKFPSQDVLQSYGITTFLQDITKPFPEHMKGYFDLVNMRYLRFSLKEPGWELALRNLSTILKPGGFLCLAETDDIFYGPSLSLPPPRQGQPHDIEAAMRGNTWIHKLNAVFTFTSRKNNHIPDPSYRLPKLLIDSGYTVKDIRQNMTPFGELCSTYVGFRGSSLAEGAGHSAENLRLLAGLLIKDLFAKSELSLALGYSITSETDCEELLQEIVIGCEQEGCALVHAEYVAINGEV